VFNTVVHSRELGEVENECSLYNFRPFAMFVPKIIRVGGNFHKVMTKTILLETQCSTHI